MPALALNPVIPKGSGEKQSDWLHCGVGDRQRAKRDHQGD